MLFELIKQNSYGKIYKYFNCRSKAIKETCAN